MEILKLVKLGFFVCSLACSFSVLAQDTKVVSAFKDSYTLEKKGEYNKAIDEIKKVVSELTYDYEINLRLGWLYYASGRFTESVAYYQKAVDKRPASIEARLGMVTPAAQLGNWDQVQNQYLEILKIDANQSVVNYRLGLIYYGKKDYTKAYKYFEKVVNLYPFGYDALLMFAWTNFQMGKTREAKILFNKVLLYSPDDKSALEGLTYIK